MILKKYFFGISCFLLIKITFSCLNKTKQPSDYASSITNDTIGENALDIDSKLLTEIKKEIEQEPVKLNREVWNYDKNGNEEHYFLDKGLVFKFVNEKKAHAIFNKYYNKVIQGDDYIFLSNMDFDESFNSYYDIIIIDESNPFTIIEQIGTNGINYDIYNPDIIRKLKEWNDQVNFKFVVIDVSRIHAYMEKLPKEIRTFSNEIYEFCPDVIDQGYGSMEEMISDYQANKYFWLWWD